jgi:hypothetical protein
MRERLNKIRIKRYPPQNLSLKSLWEMVVAQPLSKDDVEFVMLSKANPHHPVIIEEMSEIVEIEVNDKAFKELMWLFKKYRVPYKPIEKGIEIRHVETRS